jgi:hypothetical protein
MRRQLPSLAGPIDVPGAVHSHVRAQHQTARERHQKMLADSADLLDGAARDRLVPIDLRKLGKASVEAADRASRQRRVQRSRRTMNAVALRHLEP